MDAKSLLLTTALRHWINEPNIEAGFERFRAVAGRTRSITKRSAMPSPLACAKA